MSFVLSTLKLTQQGTLKSNQVTCTVGETCGVSVKLISCIILKSFWRECLHTVVVREKKEEKKKSGNFVERANIVSIKQAVNVEVWPSTSFMSHFCCPWGTLLSTVLVIHIDPVMPIPVSCWRQYCSYISTSGVLAIRIDGVETVGAYIGDLWKNLETLSGRWEKQQQSSFNSEGPWKK